jgi:RNA polymerase sigma-70 factor (ECF subfamily)
MAVHRADLSGIRRLAATLLLNVERDIRYGLRRAWAEQNLQVDLPDPEDLNAVMHGRLCRSSLLGLPPGERDDETADPQLPCRLVGGDADLVVAVVILGEGQCEAAFRLGSAMTQRAAPAGDPADPIEIKKPERCAHFPAKGAFPF